MRIVIAVLLCGLLSSVAPTPAQESPHEMTFAELGCRNVTAARMVAFSGAAAGCLADCFSHPNRSCNVTFPDAETAACLDRAAARAVRPLPSRCAGAACPECYTSFGTCSAFADDEIARIKGFVGPGIGLVFCNDAASADGLSPAESRCQSGMTAAGRRFGKELAACFTDCQRRLRQGKLAGPEACESTRIGTLAFDGKTRTCIDRALAEAVERCDRKCDDRPECLSLSCGQFLPLLQSTLFSRGDVLFCVDEPPSVCGDGRITHVESCDPNATPNGCGGDLSCIGCHACIAPFCGDGRVTAGEACDLNLPGSCPAGNVCGFDCRCRSAGSASGAFLD